MRECERCWISGEKVKLFDVIYQGKGGLLCERCAIIENVPLIRKPNTSQLKNSEQNSGKVKILSRMPAEKKETFFREDRLKELEKNPEMQMPDKSRFNLIDNFHWEIMKIRRRKGLSHAQLAQAIHESAVALQMIEKGKLPENSGIIIKKIEQFFQINLRNMADFQTYDEKQKPVLLDEQGKELEIIPEEEKELMEEMRGKFPSQTRDISAISSSEGIDIKKAHTAGVTIGDLKALHRKKILATRQEQIEEQQKIEERKRILEAQREKDRIKLEERQKKEQEMKMKTEEMRKKLADEKKQELLKKREKEFNDIDKKLGGVELLD